MELIPFVAHSVADAVAQIRHRLGPEAVVAHVRALPARGLERLWRRARLEVLAYRPDATSPRLDLRSDAPAVPLGMTRPGDGDATAAGAPAAVAESAAEVLPGRSSGGWQVGEVLERAGLLPVNAQRVVDALQREHGTQGGRTLAEELELTRAVLCESWRRPPTLLADSIRPHVFVGPPGSGKSTCLAKWLTQSVLLEGCRARVWRLDGAQANTAEFLEVHAQVLGVPVSRSWRVGSELDPLMHFIDLPGSDWRQPAAVQDLAQRVRAYLSPHIHLVLNAAYEIPLLLAQIQAFAVLPVEDLILTHLDEETRWGKIWNLVLGTNFPIRFLGSGQNIPGDFIPAAAEQVLARQFRR